MVTEGNNGSSFYMPVAPAYSNGSGNGFGFGNDWGWIILLLLFANGGWNNGAFGGYGGGELYPWMNQSNQVNNGFRDQMINSTINGIQSSLTNGFADVQNSLCNGFAQAEIAENSRQMANMNQMFGLSQQLSQCCCDNRLATAQTQATIASENCADRQAINDGVRDIIANQTAGIQTILDKICQNELDAERRENANLRTQLQMRDLAASQTAQTAQLLADNAKQTTALEQYLNPAPIPAYVVQNPNCCYGNYGCGCGAA